MKKVIFQINKIVGRLKNGKLLFAFKILAFYFLIIISENSNAQTQEDVWDRGKNPEYILRDSLNGKEITVEYENYPFIINYNNKIKITYPDNKAKIKILLPFNKPIEITGSDSFYYNPKKIFDWENIYIISNKDTIEKKYNNSTIYPTPILYFDSLNPNIFLRDEYKTAILKARWKNKDLKIISFGLFIPNKNNGFQNWGKYSSNIKNSIFDSTGVVIASEMNYFYLTDIIVEFPDSTKTMIGSKRFQIVKNKFYGNFYNNNSVDFNYQPKFRRLYNDLRIKIEIDTLIKSKDKFQKLFDEINPYLNGIKIKFVETNPNIIFLNDYKYLEKDNYKNIFYPDLFKQYYQNQIGFHQIFGFNEYIYVAPDYFVMKVLSLVFGFDYDSKSIISGLADSLGNYHIQEKSKEYLKEVYSDGGENRIYKDLGVENPRSKTQKYTLIIVIISLLLFIIFRELILKIYFVKRFFIKNKFLTQLIACAIIAQIPIFVNYFFNYFNDEITLKEFLFSAEKYFVMFSLLVGTFLWFIDLINKKIKTFAIRLLLDFISVFAIFYLSYQIIFFVISYDYVRIESIHWQWLYIPLAVSIYRIFKLFNQRKIYELLQEKELEVSKQKELTTKAELLALQSRINPHFLYNSLNSIASLATVDKHKTEQMAIDLAKLFRYNLNKGEDILTTVFEELEMVKLYLDIEKQRFGEKLDYQVEVPEELMQFKVPIFILQPLVENAIKHGISKITELGIIKIKIEKERDFAFIKVYDNGPLFTNELIFGYGLQNIFDKLTLVYKNNYTVRFVNENEKHIEIKIVIK